MTHYEMLGVAETATADEIKAAYWTRAKQQHPDHNGGTAESTERLKALNAAYRVLRDPVKRFAYDSEPRGLRLRAKARVRPTPFRRHASVPPPQPSGVSVTTILGALSTAWIVARAFGVVSESRRTWDPSVDGTADQTGASRGGDDRGVVPEYHGAPDLVGMAALRRWLARGRRILNETGKRHPRHNVGRVRNER